MMIKLFPWDHFLSDSTLQTKQWSSHKASGNMLPTGLLKPGLGSLAEDVPKPNWQSVKGLPSCSSYTHDHKGHVQRTHFIYVRLSHPDNNPAYFEWTQCVRYEHQRTQGGLSGFTQNQDSPNLLCWDQSLFLTPTSELSLLKSNRPWALRYS